MIGRRLFIPLTPGLEIFRKASDVPIMQHANLSGWQPAQPSKYSPSCLTGSRGLVSLNCRRTRVGGRSAHGLYDLKPLWRKNHDAGYEGATGSFLFLFTMFQVDGMWLNIVVFKLLSIETGIRARTEKYGESSAPCDPSAILHPPS